MNILLLKTIHVHYFFNQPFYLLTIDCYCVNWFCTFRWRRGRRLRAVYELSMWYVFIRHKVTQPNNRPTNQPTIFFLFCLSIVPKKGKERKKAHFNNALEQLLLVTIHVQLSKGKGRKTKKNILFYNCCRRMLLLQTIHCWQQLHLLRCIALLVCPLLFVNPACNHSVFFFV